MFSTHSSPLWKLNIVNMCVIEKCVYSVRINAFTVRTSTSKYDIGGKVVWMNKGIHFLFVFVRHLFQFKANKTMGALCFDRCGHIHKNRMCHSHLCREAVNFMTKCQICVRLHENCVYEFVVSCITFVCCNRILSLSLDKNSKKSHNNLVCGSFFRRHCFLLLPLPRVHVWLSNYNFLWGDYSRVSKANQFLDSTWATSS